MIAKTLFLAKTFCTYAILFLREAKSLRDHAAGRKFAFREISGHVVARQRPT
jgi:hypothetical protein